MKTDDTTPMPRPDPRLDGLQQAAINRMAHIDCVLRDLALLAARLPQKDADLLNEAAHQLRNLVQR